MRLERHATGHSSSSTSILPTGDTPAAQTPRRRGRPRTRFGNQASEKAARALSLLVQRERLTMDEIVTELQLPCKMSLGGLTASIRTHLKKSGIKPDEAYIVEHTPGGKAWIRTAKTEEALQILRAKLDQQPSINQGELLRIAPVR